MSDMWYVGERARLTLTVTDTQGAPTDPSAVILKVKSPRSKSYQTYSGGSILRDSLGNFHCDVTWQYAGDNYYRWEADATVVEGSIHISASNFS